MASKIEVELTSHDAERDEWTWRAAGARQPRGIVPAALVWDGARVGDVARAEIQRRLDGIEVVSLTPPPQPETRGERIEVRGRAADEPAITVRTLRRERPRRRPSGAAAGSEHRSQAPSHGTPRREERPSRARRQPSPAPAPQEQVPRLRPRDTHRRAFLDSVIPEHRPIAEALLRGGLPAVRAAIARDREEALAQGRPAAPEEATLKIAEDLLPRARVALWLDRAEAALPIADTVALRDLRSVVASVDPASRDARVLEYATTLRGVLERRVALELERWLTDLRDALAGGRTVRALRLSARLPDPSAKLPEELQHQLVEVVNRELVEDTPPERWMVLIDAIANSPIRRLVAVTGFPRGASPELDELAREYAGRIPSLGSVLGVAMAAPPKPDVRAKVPQASRRPRSRGAHEAPGTASQGDASRSVAPTHLSAEASDGEVVLSDAPADDAGVTLTAEPSADQ